MTLVCDSGVILSGEIRCKSLVGVTGLNQNIFILLRVSFLFCFVFFFLWILTEQA